MSRKTFRARTQLLTAAIALYLLAGSLELLGTPIKPGTEIPKQESGSTTFVPARIGWDGPESRLQPAVRNPVLDSLTPERINSDFRQMVVSTAVPDLWLVLALISAILLLRGLLRMNRQRIRQQQEERITDRAAA